MRGSVGARNGARKRRRDEEEEDGDYQEDDLADAEGEEEEYESGGDFGDGELLDIQRCCFVPFRWLGLSRLTILPKFLPLLLGARRR